MDIALNIAVVLVFVLIGGFFAATEIALVSLRQSQIERLAGSGRRGRRLAALAGDPNRFLAAVQVGVTLAGFVSAGFGASRIAPAMEPWLVGLGLSPGVAATVAFLVVTVVIAFVSLVLGELVPKRLALQSAERVALLFAPAIDLLARVSRPFIWLLSKSTNAVVRLLGGNPHAAKEEISGAELRDMLAAHTELSEEERNLIDEVFDAGGRELREVMVPRTEVDFLDAATPLREAIAEITSAPHSRYPVVRDSTDDVIGFVHIRDLLDPARAGSVMRVGSLVREVARFPTTKAILPALTEMRRRRQHLAIVVDEYGGTAGIVTMEDLVEELIGDIEDEYDVSEGPRPSVRGGPVEVDGLLNLEDFADETGIDLPEGPYETVAGFMIAQLGQLPAVGAEVAVDGRTLTVAGLDGRRLARVLVSAPPEPEPEDAAAPVPQ